MDSKITTLIFDCFGVVCDPVLMNWYKDNRVKKGFTDENLKKILEKFDLGILSESDIADYFSKYEGVNLNQEEVQKEIDNYLNIDGELMKIIRLLKDQGLKIVLLSNANVSFFERKIYKVYPEFKTFFDEIIISSGVKMVKPNKDIYLYTLNKVNSKPEECLFIDDSKINVDSAIELGMQGLVYNNREEFVKLVNKFK